MVGLGFTTNQASPIAAVRDLIKTGTALAMLAFGNGHLDAYPPAAPPDTPIRAKTDDFHPVSALVLESPLLTATLPPAPPLETQNVRRPDYPVVLAGGGHLPKTAVEIFGRWAGQENVLVIAWASKTHADVYFKESENLLTQAGVKRVVRMPDIEHALEAIARSEASGTLDAQDPRLLLQQASGVWFTGGAQARAIERLVRANMLEPLQQWVAANRGPIGGTSAGCAMMSAVMIGGSGIAEPESLFGLIPTQYNYAWTTPGVGVLLEFVTDQHFDKRPGEDGKGREPRLREVVANAPEHVRWGIGVDESAVAIVAGVGDQRYIDVFGVGGITLIPRNSDGSCGESIRVVPGQRYHLKKAQLIPMESVPESADHYEKLAVAHTNPAQ